MDLLERAKQKLAKQKADEIAKMANDEIAKMGINEKKIITEKKAEKPIKEEEILDLNKSLELNLIKSLYANRFGSTTNKVKEEMINEIINKWNKENKKGDDV